MPRSRHNILRRIGLRSGEDEHSASESESKFKSTADISTAQGEKPAPARPDLQDMSEKPKKFSFWAKAYQDIMDDEDKQTRRMLEAYDALLERARRTDSAVSNSETIHTKDTRIKSAGTTAKESRDHSLIEGKNEDHFSESEPSDSGSIPTGPPTERVVGDEVKMREVVKKSLEEMQQKEWVMSWHGHVFEVRDQVTRIVGIVQKMSGFVSPAAGLNPYSGLAWAGVCVLLPMIISDTEERQTAIGGVSRATQLAARYKTVEEDYLSGMHGENERFENTLVALYRSITLFYIKATCYFAKSTLKRMLRGVAALDDWASDLTELTKADEECQAFVNSLGLSASLKKGDRILEMLNKLETNDQVDRIKGWLLPDVDVDKQHLDKQDKLGSEFKNSGRWFLDSDEFQGWKDTTSAQLWISGSIGTGKTSLVSIVVDSLRSVGTENIAFFYYSVDISNTLHTPNNNSRLEQVFRGLIGQLAMSLDKKRVAEEVEIAFEDAVKEGTLQPAPLGWKRARDLLIKIIASRRNTTIIIDGIDEFPEFATLLKQLNVIYHGVEPGKLRLLLSSQAVVPVSEYFPSAILMVAGGEKSKLDMRAFVEKRVELFRAEHKKALDQMVADDMVDTLSEKAEGMFKWADLCLKQVLYDDDTVHIQRNWKFVKEQHFRGLLVELVASYEQLYEKSFSKGYSKQRRSELDNDASRILLWVLGAKTQLGWKEYSALYPDGDVLTGPVSKACQNFLHSSENAMIAASHSSVWDYVSLKTTGQVKSFIKCAEGDENEERSSASILEEAKKSTALLAQKMIAEDCLKLIMDSDDTAFSVDGETQNSLLNYACCNWHKHVDMLVGEEGVPSELRNQVRAMFDSRYITRWISAYDSHSSHTTTSPDPLYYATLLGYSDIVKLLMKFGPIPRAGGRFGQALQLAAFQGKIAIVHELLEEGFDINHADKVLGTPLQAAIAGGQLELANTLMDDYGANVDASGATFGSALQMALALHDQSLEASLRNHGAGPEKTNRVNKVWAKAWVLAQTTGFNIDRATAMLRIVSPISALDLDLPRGLDNRLEALALCIHLRRPMKSEFPGPGRREEAQTTNPNEGEIWQTARERLHQSEIGASGFLPATFTWLLLVYGRFGTDNIKLSLDVFGTIFKILRQHERFVTTFPENIPCLELEESLSYLFAHLILMVYFLTEQSERVSRRRTKFKILKWSRLGNDLENKLKDELKELEIRHKAALTMEDNAKSMATLHQVLSGYNDCTTSELQRMGQEITGLKEDIKSLSDKMDLLFSLMKD